MPATRVLTQSELRPLLGMETAVPAIEEIFAAHGRGETLMPVKVYLNLEEHHGDFRAMPSYAAGAAGVKWINAHPENPQRHGLPSVIGMYILNDPATALPLAVMDATYLTAVRTGVAAAVASKYLARSGSSTLGLIGCGAQAPMLLEAHRFVFPELEVVCADRSETAAASFAAEHGCRVGTLREAAGCDIVCTATPSRRPIVERAWVRSGAHVNAMGADAPGKQELDVAILREARVVLDDVAQASESGEVNVPLHRGDLDPSAIGLTLGRVVAGLEPGRRTDDEITVFDSTGLAVQDLALARVVYRRATGENVGREVDFLA